MDNLSEQVSLIILSSVFLLIVIVGVIYLVFNYQRRQFVHLREKQQLKEDFEKQILESKLEIQEQTFKNISQEIHDNIGQILSLAKLTINTMYSSDEGSLKQKIDHSKELVAKAITDLRHLSHRLHTDHILDRGLLRAVEEELAIIGNATTCELKLHTEGTPFRLEHKEELIIFRIFQEAMQNILKHSGARNIAVVFTYQTNQLTLKITDDGKGFERRPETSAGIGLKNMQHRARLIDAQLEISSHPGQGTAINLILPVDHKPEQNE